MISQNRISKKQFYFNKQINLWSCSNSTNKNIKKLLKLKLKSVYLIQLMLLISFLAIVQGECIF